MTSALETLKASASAASGPGSRAEALAKVGVCLAQLGRTDEAASILSELRLGFSAAQYPRVSIRLMILEGVVSYYESLGDSSDRIRRAKALAKMARVPDLQAEASVWLAHLSFNFENYPVLAESIADGLDGFSSMDDSHRARLCLTVADVLQYLAERLDASEWYILARILARRVHDHGLMAAIEYNRIGIGLSRIRVDRVLGRESSDSAQLNWLAELRSVERLHVGLDARALSELFELCGAYSYEASGDFLAAGKVYARIRDSGAAGRCGVSEALLDVEIDWCGAKTGDEAAIQRLSSIDQAAVTSLPPNEQLVALVLIRDVIGNRSSIWKNGSLDLLIQEAVDRFDQSIFEMNASIKIARESHARIRSTVLAPSN